MPENCCERFSQLNVLQGQCAKLRTEHIHTHKIITALQQIKDYVFEGLCQDEFLKFPSLFILFPLLFRRSQPSLSLAAVRHHDPTWKLCALWVISSRSKLWTDYSEKFTVGNEAYDTFVEWTHDNYQILLG